MWDQISEGSFPRFQDMTGVTVGEMPALGSIPRLGLSISALLMGKVWGEGAQFIGISNGVSRGRKVPDIST